MLRILAAKSGPTKRVGVLSLRIVEATDSQLEGWDDLVRRSPEGNVFQTRMWGEFWREYVGGTPRYWLAVTETDEPVGLLVALCDAILWEPFFERPLGTVILAVLRRAVCRQHINNGPIVLVPAHRDEVLSAFSDHLAGQSRIHFPITVVTMTTPTAGGADDAAAPMYVSDAFRPNGFTVDELYTNCVDLRVEEEVLWSQLHRSARKAVNRARREGVTVRRVESEEEFALLHRHLKEARTQLGLRTYSLRNWTVMWKHLAQGQAAHMFVAQVSDRILAGLGVWSFGRIITEFSSAMTEAGRATTAGDLLKWEVILWGRQQGYSYYDLAGLNPRDDATEKERQIARFKRKWGGRDIPIHRLTRYPLGWMQPR